MKGKYCQPRCTERRESPRALHINRSCKPEELKDSTTTTIELSRAGRLDVIGAIKQNFTPTRNLTVTRKVCNVLNVDECLRFLFTPFLEDLRFIMNFIEFQSLFLQHADLLRNSLCTYR
jgi:hypothetical protein